ncbi:hypothetical protein EYF80_018635 [Liparis tanakae]|uniref:Uncharacterized protein n=1 Tax=Liparis tanakae TaxID=230148 RepID=A0A4Z2I0K0_9TELE|nr:hypothetical protein EYF80_018635 [Liparis tanakae]
MMLMPPMLSTVVKRQSTCQTRDDKDTDMCSYIETQHSPCGITRGQVREGRSGSVRQRGAHGGEELDEQKDILQEERRTRDDEEEDPPPETMVTMK